MLICDEQAFILTQLDLGQTNNKTCLDRILVKTLTSKIDSIAMVGKNTGLLNEFLVSRNGMIELC